MKLEMKELKQAIKEENKKRLSQDVERANNDLKNALSYNRKKYKGDEETQKKKLIRYLKRNNKSGLNEELARVEEVENHNIDFPKPLIITLEWKKSYMWGMNPKAYTNYGFEGSSIGGCGYCKTSTATAQALNSNLSILKRLYTKEEERLKQINKSKMTKADQEKYLSRRAFIGYGSGYSAIPIFEGGVGVNSHQSICENMGFKFSFLSETKYSNVYMVEVEK